MNVVPRKALLICGILSSLLYVVMNIVVAMRWAEYSSASQTVSELSAVGAPTRHVWVLLAIPYTVLVAAFGLGVWAAAPRARVLRVVGGLITVYGLLGIAWPFAPMHLREALAAGGGSLSDTMHIVLAAATVVLMMIAIGLAAAAFRRRFRIYSIATMAALFVFGGLTGIDGPRISKGLDTPLVGVWERLSIGAFLLWVVVLAVVLLRRTRPVTDERRSQEVENEGLLLPTA